MFLEWFYKKKDFKIFFLNFYSKNLFNFQLSTAILEKLILNLKLVKRLSRLKNDVKPFMRDL